MRNIRFDIFLRKCPLPIRKLIDPLIIEEEEFIKEASRIVHSNQIVLDAGAGECKYKTYFPHTSYIALDFLSGDNKWNYSGVDVSGDVINIPLKSNTIDLIINTQVLEHVSEPEKTIHEFYRILKPGGRLFLTTPQGWYEHQIPHDYFRYTSYGLTHLFHKAGFRVDFIKPMGGYFRYLAYRLIFLPKVLFWQRNMASRIFLFPLELLCYVFFVGLMPPILNSLDFLDHERRCTLAYKCCCTKNISR